MFKKPTVKYIIFLLPHKTMNIRLFLVLLILTAALPNTVVYSQGHRVMTGTIETESGRRTVEIRYYAESEEWAKDVFKTIREGFPLLEEKIGVPCPVAWDILLEETTFLEAGVGGVNKGPLGMVVPTDTSPATIIHELCHYWFGSQPSLKWSNWILEGFPEAYTIAVLKDLEHDEVYFHWYARMDQYEQAKAELGDKPLSEVGYTPNFEDPRVGMLYSKAMVYCTWLILYFGEETMHKINEQIIFMNPLRTEDYQEIAEEVTGEDLDWLFSGWVYSGEYYYEGNPVSFEWFAGDGDSDDISTVREIEIGYSPAVADTDRDGLPDGYELLLKTDVTNPDTDTDGLTDGEEVPIIIDGKNTEWLIPLTTDPEGDSASQNPQDLKAFYYATDDTNLYFMIEFYNKFSTAYHSGIRVDTDTDGKTDFIFFLIYDHLYLSIWDKGEWVETVCDPNLLKGATVVADQVIEFRIPKRMRQVTFPSQFNVSTYEFSVIDEEISDQTSSISVSLDQNPKKGTNPRSPDTDGDGIGDGEDTDPLVITSPEEAAEEETPEEKTVEGAEEAEPGGLEAEGPGETQKPEAGTSMNWLLVIIGIAAGGIVVVVLVVKVFLRKPEVTEKVVLPEPEKPERPVETEAFQILRDRYTRGKISKEEYERIKSKLEETEPRR